ncbi:MAG: hypothetical protein HKN87_03460 [Saprospiraceae bacterium]|nr:hypothetical protein [Saprospiraceae bacterium]
MTHFHQNHRWRLSGLFSDFVVPKLDWDENHGDEVQADVYGTFLSYQAGYNTLTIVPELLDSIYAFYDLPATANRLYPSLKERKGLASDACEVSANLIELYQMANYLMVVGRFKTAAHLYQHVASIIQFKEAHYNLGLCRMMSYLSTCNDPLSYPISIDSHIPLERTHGQQNPQQILKSAQRSFELVLEDYDKDYRHAKFALIAIYGWQGNHEEAKSLISDLTTSVESSEDPYFLLTLANHYIENSDMAQGEAIYRQLLSDLPGGHPLINSIQRNINLLDGNDPWPTFTPSIQNEQNLDGVTSLLFYSDYQNEIAISQGVQFARADQFGSVLSKLTGSHGKFHMQRIASKEIRTSEGLGIGSSLSELNNRWRDEHFIQVTHVGGQYVVLWSRGLIFKLDESLVTTEWVSFSL